MCAWRPVCLMSILYILQSPDSLVEAIGIYTYLGFANAAMVFISGDYMRLDSFTNVNIHVSEDNYVQLCFQKLDTASCTVPWER